MDSEFGENETCREMSVQYVPENTKKKNNLAHINYILWLDSRNQKNSNYQCPVNLIDPLWDMQVMVRWLPRCACKMHNMSGGQHPSSMIISLLSSVLCRSRVLD